MNGASAGAQGSSGSLAMNTASNTNATGSGVPPTLTVGANALTVNEGGSVALPIGVSPASGGHATTVTIAGLTSYETLTDTLDHKVFTGDSITLTAAEVNSGLSLASNYTGADHPVNTLTVTATEIFGHHALTTDAQTIVVTDPPASTAPASTSTTSTTTGNPLTLQVSGDMFNGDPQIQVFVDGQQVGGTYDITAHHSLGQTQTISIDGNFDPSAAHQVQVKFVNDTWDGTPNVDGHDRNVYVSSISLNGATIQGQNFASDNAAAGMASLDPHAAVMLVNGTTTYNVPADPPASGTGTAAGSGGTSAGGTGTAAGSGGTTAGGTGTAAGSGSTSTGGTDGTTGTGVAPAGNPLTLQVSGDMFNGDPQIQVFVDGQQVGGTYDITAHHSLGQTQTISINGNFAPLTAHQVQVKFVNDTWDGTPNVDGHDRNVYVSSISLNGFTIQGQSFASDDAAAGMASLDPHAAVMLVNGTATFDVPPDPPAGGSAGGTGSTGGGTSASGGTSTGATTGAVGTGTGPTPSGAGFYVSPNGSDSNPGTLAAPFATLQRAQQAMEHSSIKATYVEGGTYHLSSGLVLTAADNGETWQYYPANGVDSAILDGGNQVARMIQVDADNITINGLTIQHFTNDGIYHDNGSTNIHNLTVINCNVGFNTAKGTWQAVGIGANGIDGAVIKNNYIHDLQAEGIDFNAFQGGLVIDNLLIDSNVVLRTGQGMNDVGAIYTEDPNFVPSTNIMITNNYVKDNGSSTDAHDIYLDLGSNHTIVSGNVLGAPNPNSGGSTGMFLSDGWANQFTNNIFDLGSSGHMLSGFFWYETPAGFPINSLSVTDNIIISDFSGAAQSGVAFLEQNDSNAGDYTIANNLYYNYGGGQMLTNGSIAGDSHPMQANPMLSGWNYQLAANSPALGGSINFKPIVGGWGPAGFVIPQTGVTPSDV